MDDKTISIILFLVVIAGTVSIAFAAGRRSSGATDFYAGGRSFSGFQNGLAIGGDYMSAASFLGISGIIALSGYDGFLYSIGFLVAWLVALLLVAELLRNSGKFTMADQLAYRMKQRPVRTAAATSTVVVSIVYLLAQMVGASALVVLLFDISPDNNWAKNLIVIGVGALMILYVTIGGMKGTTWVQIVKAVLLMAGAALLVVLVLAKFDFSISQMLGAAAEQSGIGEKFLQPGAKYGATTTTKLDFLSLGLALVLGTAGLPHILVRFYTVPTSRDARKSVLWAIGLIGVFYLFTLVLGFGAAALVGSGDIAKEDKAGNMAAPMLAEVLGGGAGSTGGAILLAVIAAVAFATILAVVAGLTLTSSTSVAHDIYNNVLRKGQATEEEEIRMTRYAAAGIGTIAILLAIPAQSLNVAFLVALAFAIAASGNLPAMVFNLFWRRFNTRGALWAIYGGLLSSIVLVFFSPVVSGKTSVNDAGETVSAALFPLGVDFHWFPLDNPGLVSIPLGFFFGWLGTVTAREPAAEDRFTELEVRALTGAGAEQAVQH